MKINIANDVLFRVPSFPTNASLYDYWPQLKLSIKISSPSFYEIIKDVCPDDLPSLPFETFRTIWKYFNRSKYRATPYGSFSAIGSVKLTRIHEEGILTISNDQSTFSMNDWTTEVPQHNIDAMILVDIILQSNSSFYQVAGSIRYLRNVDGTFELSEIEKDDAINSVLNHCLKPKPISELIQLLSHSYDQLKIKDILSHLIDTQLLLTSHHRNIIGQDYFERIGMPSQPELDQYIISRRNLISGDLDQNLFRHVPALVDKLKEISVPFESQRFQNFTSNFLKKFEDKEIPIMVALDPELGIGYDDAEQGSEEDDFLRQLAEDQNAGQPDSHNLRLLKSIVGHLGLNAASIDLEKVDFSLPDHRGILPNSLSIMCTASNDTVLIDHIGGSTANALLGRFSHADIQVSESCKAIALAEQSSNPDCIFFDIGYAAEGKIDNVNRRKTIYDHQLSILTFNTGPEELSPTDILVSVQGNEVVLRSKHLNKRLIPRLASAYNYQRSDLSLFKFLCDLQNQNLQVDLNFSLKRIVSGLYYYPSVKFRNLVLSPRSWKLVLEKNFLNPRELSEHLNRRSIPNLVKVGDTDQTLVFDLKNELDLKILISVLKKQKTIYLDEILLPEHSLIRDECGNGYLGQFVLSILHNESIYKGLNGLEPIADYSIPSVFLPGSEWLYFEIFCHSIRTDAILTDFVYNFIGSYHKKIAIWFFIRYNEHGNHIRLRLRLHDPQDSYLLIAGLTKVLYRDAENGVISDVRVRTYKREMERYDPQHIEQVEVHFATDSKYVLRALQNLLPIMDKYRLCVNVAEHIATAEIFTHEEYRYLIQKLSDSFSLEHEFRSVEFKKLNQQFQLFLKSVQTPVPSTLQSAFIDFKASFVRTLSQCESTKRRKLFADLMHMHVNRLFCTNQRVHEAIIYYFLWKLSLANTSTEKRKSRLVL